MIDLIHDHILLAVSFVTAIIGALWLASLYYNAPVVQDDDARFFGES